MCKIESALGGRVCGPHHLEVYIAVEGVVNVHYCAAPRSYVSQLEVFGADSIQLGNPRVFISDSQGRAHPL